MTRTSSSTRTRSRPSRSPRARRPRSPRLVCEGRSAKRPAAAPAQSVTYSIAALIGVAALLLGVIVGILLPINVGGASTATPDATPEQHRRAAVQAPQLTPEQMQSGQLPPGHPSVGAARGPRPARQPPRRSSHSVKRARHRTRSRARFFALGKRRTAVAINKSQSPMWVKVVLIILIIAFVSLFVGTGISGLFNQSSSQSGPADAGRPGAADQRAVPAPGRLVVGARCQPADELHRAR